MKQTDIYSFDIALKSGSRITLKLFAESENTLKQIYVADELNAKENCEEKVQLVEGSSYQYELLEEHRFRENPLIKVSKLRSNEGRIVTGTNVGKLPLCILDSKDNEVAKIALEIRSLKLSYNEDYRSMLEFIAEKSIDLVMTHNYNVLQSYTQDYHVNPQALYQRFAFIKSILESDEFKQAINRILSSPLTSWQTKESECDIRRSSRLNSHHLKQIAGAGNRTSLPENHYLRRNNILSSLPLSITSHTKIDSVDTVENRFIKYALQSFLAFCSSVRIKLQRVNTNIFHIQEAEQLENKLNELLNADFFKHISPIKVIPLNNPSLQRKEGYREILRAWLLFDIAAKLIWKGGEDVYDAGKKDIAILYEYWVFFKLVDICKDVFKLNQDSLKTLIVQSNEGLGLNLKSGKQLPLSGQFSRENRNFQVEFSYNRTFKNSEYPDGGSWTKAMRPDYTISIWPAGVTANQAEKLESIVHIHFDAKYRVELQFDTSDLDIEKRGEKEGKYKRGDLLKMHAYKDAIRRTAGAYIIYPGTQSTNMKGFHEIIPGLGAFPLVPSSQGLASSNDKGSEKIRNFIEEVITNLCDRLSQRERVSYYNYSIYKEPSNNEFNNQLIKENIPDYVNEVRVPFPSEVSVLIGYKKDKHKELIDKGYYIFRADGVKGALPINARTTGAMYLVLHSDTKFITSEIYKIHQSKDVGNLKVEVYPKVCSKREIKSLGYKAPKHSNYLLYHISRIKTDEFENIEWDIQKLKSFDYNKRFYPLVVSLTELMATALKG